MTDNSTRPEHAKLKAQLDQRFTLYARFMDYHSASRAEYWDARQGHAKPSETADALRALYEVATSLHRLIISWTKTRGDSFTPGDEHDPQTFWNLAQPQQKRTMEVVSDLIQTHQFVCGPEPYVPGLIDIYVRLITHELFLRTPQVVIDCVLWSFGSLFFVACLDPKGFITGPTQSSASNLILVHTDRIWKHFWDNRARIQLRPQSARDAQRHPVLDSFPMAHGSWPEPFSRLISWYSFLYDRHNKYLQTHATHEQRVEREFLYSRYRDTCMPFVGLHLWVSGKPTEKVYENDDDPHHMLAPLAAVVLDNNVERAPEDLDDNESIARKAILEGVGADAYFEHFKEEMQRLHEAEYKVDPGKCVSIMTSVAKTEALRPFLAKYDVWQPIVAMCHLHIRNRSPRRQVVWVGVQYFFWFIGERLEESFDDITGKELAVRVNGSDIVDYIARGIDLLSERDFDVSTNTGGWKKLSVQISKYCERIAAFKDQRTHYNEASVKLLNEFRARASSLWWMPFRRLKTAHDRDQSTARPDVNRYRQDVLSSWENMGEILELIPTSEAQRFLGRNGTLYCSWGWCEHHTSKPPATVPLKSCKGCGEVKYCSRACQVRHWKEEHKTRCGKRLRAES